MAKINIPHTKCEKGQTKSFLTGSAIFSYTHLENLAQVYRVNYLYIYIYIYIYIYVIYIRVWDRGQGDTVASQSSLCWPYNTPKHMAHRHSVRRRTLENMTEMMILICIVLAYKPRFSCQYESTMGARCSRSAYATLLRCSRAAHACSVKRALQVTHARSLYLCIFMSSWLIHSHRSRPMQARRSSRLIHSRRSRPTQACRRLRPKQARLQ